MRAGEALDARSDIFSFGAVLYEAATGQRAFAGDSQVATLAAVLNNAGSIDKITFFMEECKSFNLR